MFKKSSRYSFGKGVPRQKSVTPFYVLRFQKSEDPTYAVVVGKKVSKKATQRNKVKRMFISCLQEELKKIPNSYDLVFFLRLSYQEYQKSAIMDELSRLLVRLNA
ncbi:MAG: ribonuclease P protein component [Candidatus Levyibacteriota bacterium]